MENYRALVVRETTDGFEKKIETVAGSFLPKNEVLVKVHYAGLNYKDALSASGHKGITRNFPHTPGVDAAGEVVSDSTGKFSQGDLVICTGRDLGMNTFGGFSQYISVPSDWLIPLPEALTLEESMICGTAAFTASLALYKMERAGQEPSMGEIMVTGATGGVGSMAVSIFSQAGYDVVASSGKESAYDFLKSLGAKRCVGRDIVNDSSGRPLLRSQWAGAVDNVGGNTLSTLLRSCDRNGTVASIGLVDTHEFDITVYPFILNGIALVGIDSAETPSWLRKELWTRLSKAWKPAHLQTIKKVVSLEEIPQEMDEILKGKTQGRVVAKIEH